MLVVDVIYRHHSWVGLYRLIVSLLLKLAWDFLAPCKLVLREEAFKSIPPQGILGPVSEIHHVFTIVTFLPILGVGNQGQQQLAGYLGEFFGVVLANNLEECFSSLVLEFL